MSWPTKITLIALDVSTQLGWVQTPKTLIKKGLNFDLKPFLSIASHSFVMSTENTMTKQSAGRGAHLGLRARGLSAVDGRTELRAH